MILNDDQIQSFNAYQASGRMHPFTCQQAHAEGRDLVAREDGLHCPHCPYVQDWAHDWMLNWQWKRTPFETAWAGE